MLPTAILACLAAGPLHGYAIAQRLGDLGLGTPKGGSLYPVLGRLETAGDVRADWVEGPSGPGRKEYTITPAGRDHLDADRAALDHLAAILHTIRSHPATPGDPR